MCATRSVPDIYSKYILHIFYIYCLICTRALQILYDPHFEDEESKERAVNKQRSHRGLTERLAPYDMLLTTTMCSQVYQIHLGWFEKN